MLLKIIEKVIYEKESIAGLSEYLELEINDCKNILKYRDIGGIKREFISKEDVIEYLDKLFTIIDGWKSNYQNNDIIDGIKWQLQITYKNGKVQKFTGKNDFPSNFKYLDEIKYEIIHKSIGE